MTLERVTGVDVLGVIDSMQFDPRGYCPACNGWNRSANGATPRKHTKDCGLIVARKRIAELLAAADAMSTLYGHVWDRHVWDRTDGSLVVFPENIERFDNAFNRLCDAINACRAEKGERGG